MVEALGLKADNPPVIPPPAPCHSFSGRHAGADVHIVCFGEPLAQPRNLPAVSADGSSKYPPQPAQQDARLFTTVPPLCRRR